MAEAGSGHWVWSSMGAARGPRSCAAMRLWHRTIASARFVAVARHEHRLGDVALLARSSVFLAS